MDHHPAGPAPSSPVAAASVEPVGPRTFALDQDALPRVRRRVIRRLVVVLAMTSIAAMTFVLLRQDSHAPLAPVVIVAVAFPLLMIPGFRKGLRRTRDDWVSYRLVLAPDAVTRVVADRPDLVLAKSAVVAIDERPDQVLVIRGASADAPIAIPSEVLDRPGLRAALATWKPITVHSARGWGFVPIAAAMAAMIAVMVAAFSAQVAWSVPGALVMTIGGGWCFWHTAHNVHLDRRTRRLAWIGVVPIVAALGHAVMLLVR